MWRSSVIYKRRASSGAEYTTVEIDRGEIAEVVGATGTLQAVTTVQVGSQVSGIIQSLSADFNSVVAAGQVVARLDPSTFEARLGQAKANLASAKANVDRARAQVEDAKNKFGRAKELLAQQLVPVSDYETAKANYDGAVAQQKAAEAAVNQADASVHQAEVDLDHTVIRAPIAGVVVNRSVDVGQTVAASFQAPTIFIIANDLSKMQVNASIDEADIGRIQTGQAVCFRVDAYPERAFDGIVEQIRLQPTTVQNVVTYNTIIAVNNPEQLLKPGMTATVSLITRKVENVLRVSAAALRFRPEGFEAEGAQSKGSGPAAAGATQAPARGPGAGEGRTTGAGPAGSGVAMAAEGRRGEGRQGPPEGARTEGSTSPGEARRGSREGRRGGGPDGAGGGRGKSALVFVLDEKGKPQPVRIVVGLSDGQFTEVRDGLAEGSRVVTALGADRSPQGGAPGAQPAAPSSRSSSGGSGRAP